MNTQTKETRTDLDTQLDPTATELFERTPKFKTLEEIEAALQEGIYG